MHRTLRLSLLAPCLLALACSASMLAADSAEPTDCPAEQLEVTDVHQPMEGPSSWTATCKAPGKEQRWFCSRMDINLSVICTEDPSSS